MVNAGFQFIKSNLLDAFTGLDGGVVEYNVFEYKAGPPAGDHGAGVGYFNGINAHTVKNCVVRKNLFKNLHNPDFSAYTWNPALLFWNHSSGTITEKNIFINVDRAVGYGLIQQASGFDYRGGVIRNNFVYLQPGVMSAGRKASSDGEIIA